MSTAHISAETPADIDAMSVEEIDAAIAELRRRQEADAREGARRLLEESAASLSLSRWLSPPPIEEAWKTDADNLSGDMERVGRDMWIAVLRAERARKTA